MPQPVFPAAPKFMNIQVIVQRVSGVAPRAPDAIGGYDVSYFSDGLPVVDGNIQVQAANVVVNYQLIAPTPDEIRFSGMTTKVKGDGRRQLSQPSISLDGKMMTFCDACDEHGQIAVTFFWTDGVQFHHDPEIVNNPNPRESL